MIKIIEAKQNLQLARIEIPNCAITKGIITIDLYETNSLIDQTIIECFGDLLLSGTTSLSRDELMDKVNSLGSSVDVHFNDGVLTVEISGTEKNWKKTLAIVSDVLQNPTFTAKEIKRATKLAFNDLNDDKEDAKAIAQAAFENNFFTPTDRRAGVQITTLQSHLSKLTNKDIKQMFTRMYTKPWVTSVTGSESTCTSFAKLVTELTSSIEVVDNTTRSKGAATTSAKLLLNDIPSKQNLDLNIGLLVDLKPGDLEFPALVFGISVLAKWGGFAGRLMSTVREKEGLTYGIYGKLAGYNTVDTGYFVIQTFFSPTQVTQGLQSTFREINKIYKHGITETEHISFKTIMETQTIMRNDSPISSIRVLHEFNKLGFTIEQMEAYETQLQSVSKKEVDAAIKKYLNPKLMVISAAGPTKQVEKELQILSKKL
jgi:zinc protease